MLPLVEKCATKVGNFNIDMANYNCVSTRHCNEQHNEEYLIVFW